MPVPIASLQRPQPALEVEVYLDGEAEFYASFSRHLHDAKHLIEIKDARHYEGALYLLYMAVECLLKDIFCILRHHAGFDARCVDLFRSKNIVPLVGGKSFGHDLKALAAFLNDHIPELRTDSDYKFFRMSLPEKDWIDDRYKKTLSNNSFGEFQALFGAYVQLSNSAFVKLVKAGDR